MNYNEKEKIITVLRHFHLHWHLSMLLHLQRLAHGMYLIYANIQEWFAIRPILLRIFCPHPFDFQNKKKQMTQRDRDRDRDRGSYCCGKSNIK